jgi:hypothetical protein
MSEKGKRIGNHKVIFCEPGQRKFYYHSTCICYVDDNKMTFRINRGGYGTRSTSRTVNEYREKFTQLGYREIVSE